MTFNCKLLFAIALCTILPSCEAPETTSVQHQPVTFEYGEECHLCGMLILNFEGPKAQAFEVRQPKIKKFCSTLDMFAWYFQPENKPNTQALFVHDMAQTDWQRPDDTKLIDAKIAYYVIGSTKRGSMGKTFASFKKREDAEAFISDFSGDLKTFDELSLELTMM